jgi:hypothetical protein
MTLALEVRGVSLHREIPSRLAEVDILRSVFYQLRSVT